MPETIETLRLQLRMAREREAMAQQAARAPEPGLDLVAEQQRAVLVAEPAQAGQV